MAKPIPIETAATLAREHELAGLVIVGFESVAPHGDESCGAHRTHVTSYGVTADDKCRAARIGDFVQQQIVPAGQEIDVHADFRQEFDAGILREALELLAVVRARQGITPPQLQQIERLLRGVRQG